MLAVADTAFLSRLFTQAAGGGVEAASPTNWDIRVTFETKIPAEVSSVLPTLFDGDSVILMSSLRFGDHPNYRSIRVGLPTVVNFDNPEVPTLVPQLDGAVPLAGNTGFRVIPGPDVAAEIPTFSDSVYCTRVSPKKFVLYIKRMLPGPVTVVTALGWSVAGNNGEIYYDPNYEAWMPVTPAPNLVESGTFMTYDAPWYGRLACYTEVTVDRNEAASTRTTIFPGMDPQGYFDYAYMGASPMLTTIPGGLGVDGDSARTWVTVPTADEPATTWTGF